VAGDKVSHAATRSQMCCAVTGQAAGVAAAVSLRTGRSTAGVDVAAVQAELRRQGVRIEVTLGRGHCSAVCLPPAVVTAFLHGQLDARDDARAQGSSTT
jgi:hypothetical protein